MSTINYTVDDLKSLGFSDAAIEQMRKDEVGQEEEIEYGETGETEQAEAEAVDTVDEEPAKEEPVEEEPEEAVLDEPTNLNKVFDGVVDFITPETPAFGQSGTLLAQKEALDAKVRSLGQKDPRLTYKHDGIYTHDNESIYYMTEPKFQAYVTALEQDNRIADMTRVLQERQTAQREWQAYTQTGADLYQQTQSVEWDLLAEEVLRAAPSLQSQSQNIINALTVKLQDPQTNSNASTPQGKKLLLGRVLKELNLVSALKGAKGEAQQGGMPKPQKESQTPEVGMVTKKANRTEGTTKPTFTAQQIEKMSLAEFTKNEEAIDLAMVEGRIK